MARKTKQDEYVGLDAWLLNNPDYSQEQRELIIEAVESYVKTEKGHKAKPSKWTKHLICGVNFCMLRAKVPAGYKVKLGEPSGQYGGEKADDELVLYAYKK